MDSRLNSKSDLYVFGGYLLLGLAILLNPITIPMLQGWGFLPPVPSHHLHENDIRFLLPALLDVFALVNGALIAFGKRPLRYYLNDSFAYNLFMFGILLAIMFSLNVIHPGRFNLLRILYLIVLLFFATNTLFQGIVKQRNGTEVHAFYRNIGVSLYGIVVLLILLEGIFMFHQQTHRFNGTLGSRSWFLKNWELNSEGYRDAPYDSTAVNKKRKVLVIGDSFVAGHGIKNPLDRFSDRLGALLPNDRFRVFNLGVGGSDTYDENNRLREFPFKPDILIFSWYPNDIEEDGERGGLILQHARSYHDIWGPARYFARRSFLWNYLYWRFPHPDELSDYFGYIQQCFSYLKVRNQHLLEIDRLVQYGDSLHIPMAAVVFPFLENAEGSAFATDIIEQRFRKASVPVLSIRQMMIGKQAIDYIVNQNDPHPNEKLHALVADSLFQILTRIDAFSEKPKLEIPLEPVIEDNPIIEPSKTKESKPATSKSSRSKKETSVSDAPNSDAMQKTDESQIDSKPADDSKPIAPKKPKTSGSKNKKKKPSPTKSPTENPQ